MPNEIKTRHSSGTRPPRSEGTVTQLKTRAAAGSKAFKIRATAREAAPAHIELAASKESGEKCCRFLRDTDDLVRCLTIEFEIELGLGSTVVPAGKSLSPLRPSRRFARAVSLTVMLTRGVCRAIPRFCEIALAEVTTPLAMRPGPPSFSLAKTKIVSPLAMCLPPYMVFCARNAKVFAHGSLTSALIAKTMLFISHH